MALQVWLPLNGQFENQGLLGPLTQTAAPTYVDGKFGKALASGGCSMTAEQTASVLNNEAVSICFWVYINAETGATPTGTNMLFGNNSPRRFSLFAYQTVNDLHCSWENADGSYLIASVDKGVLPSYTWTHVTVTYQNPEIKIYINGKCIRTHSGVSNVDFNYVTQVIYNVTWRYFNDFRIYDHCLSEKEIKEIYKGLVLHYPLNGGEGGINLFKNTLEYYSTSSGHTHIGTTPVFDTDLMSLNSLIGKTITFTFDYSIEGDKLNTSGDYTAMRYGAHLGASYIDASGNSGYAYPCASELHESPTPEGTHRAVQTYTFPSDWQSIQSFTMAIQPFNQPAANNTATWYIKNFKVELGDVDTGYSINPNTLGIAAEITDCSGFGNNGIRSGVLAHNGNSARYDASTEFAAKSHIKIPKPMTISNESQFTLSIWVKPKSGCGAYSTILSNYNNPPSGFWAAINTEGNGAWFYNLTYAYSGTGLLALDSWHHLAMVFNAGSITWYVDGAKGWTTDVSSKTTQFTDYIAIGNSYTGSNWNTDFVGNISDVRIYATALAADDIKELYSTAASLDKEGNMYAYEFKED